MKKFLDIREIQLEEKKILDIVVDFLDKNNIDYFLYAGTLLGAVRHKGFIPWDDDIDIGMTRKNYDKLQKIIKDNNKLNDNVFFHSYEAKNLNMPFTKVYNHKIEIFDWRYNDKYEKYLWIDIFPIDSLPDEQTTIEIFKKRDFWKKIMMYRKMSFKYLLANKTPFKNITKLLLKLIFNILPEKIITKKILGINKYRYNNTGYSGDFVWGYGPKERMKNNIYEEYINIEFEGSYYKGLKKYHEFLTNIYGDYMKLPPKKNRITHSFKAWRVDENEKENK